MTKKDWGRKRVVVFNNFGEKVAVNVDIKNPELAIKKAIEKVQRGRLLRGEITKTR
ncbi:MAG: hypothetical protein PHH24_04470 [Candidatus Moranbacteria bacterium]|jgi:hypothetical protein|nr:hypothetical protein [Candidatus Moranbacteria bacterium]MDX9855930.1 hypothetical protein [Candidatus Moranbacteria bacterium]